MSLDIIVYCALTSLVVWAVSLADIAIPALCYNECNNVYIEAQSLGKNPALCANSSFPQDVTACQQCVVSHSNTTAAGLNSTYLLDFQPFLDYCAGEASNPLVVSTFSSLLSRDSIISSIEAYASSLGVTLVPSAAPTAVESRQPPPSSTASAAPRISVTTVFTTPSLSSTLSSTSTPLSNNSTSSTNHTWIAGAVVGPIAAIFASLLVLFFIIQRRKQTRIIQRIEDNPKFDKAQLHADSLPRKSPLELVGSDIIPPAELPAREDVAAELAVQGNDRKLLHGQDSGP